MNPFISVGIGTAVSIILAVTSLAGKAIIVFQDYWRVVRIQICGAMMVDYLLAGGVWPGPRAGFNPAGWLAWLAGFAVGILPDHEDLSGAPAAPVAAFIVGRGGLFCVRQAGAAIAG